MILILRITIVYPNYLFMSKAKLTSIRAVEREWKRLIDWPIDQANLLYYATSAARRYMIPDTFRSFIALLDIDQYEAALPGDFSLMCQAAYKRDPDKPCYIKQVSQWTQDNLCNDCELEINLKCPVCSEVDCDCNEPILEIPVDQMYLQANPQIHSYMKHYHDHGGITDYGTRCYYHPEFYLMRPRAGWFANMEYHIKDCIHKNIQCPVSYEIVDGEKLVVNFKKGQVLISYLGVPVDDEGLLLVPDIEEGWEAIVYFIAERESFSEYMVDSSQRNERRWQNMVLKRAEFINRARMRLRVPDPDDYERLVSNHWHKVIPYYNYWENSNLFKNDTHAHPAF